MKHAFFITIVSVANKTCFVFVFSLITFRGVCVSIFDAEIIMMKEVAIVGALVANLILPTCICIIEDCRLSCVMYECYLEILFNQSLEM